MPTPPIDHPWYWYASFAAAGAAAVGMVVWANRVWREAKGEVDDDCPTTEDLLTPLAMAYKAGQMSEEEYRRIRDSLIGVPAGTAAVVRPRTPVSPPGPAPAPLANAEPAEPQATPAEGRCDETLGSEVD